MTKTNYHTHHELCKHAKGTAKDYVLEALNRGYKEIGFSDHAPSDYIQDTHPYVRMDTNQLDEYINDIKSQKVTYKNQITILTGLEVEYLNPDLNYYKDLLHKVDYLILGQHYVIKQESGQSQKTFESSFALKEKKDILAYARKVKEAIETGYFDLVAHPDLYMCGYHTFDETAVEAANIIIDASVKFDVPLEFNANGIRKGKIKTSDGTHYQYPRIEFWKIAKSKNCKVMINSDCHEPELLDDKAVEESYKILKSLNIIPIEYLKIKNKKL